MLAKIRRYRSFSHILEEGLHVHIEENGLIQDILDINHRTLTPQKGLQDASAFRQVVAPNSEWAKARTQEKTKQRGKRQQAITGDYDDE